MLSWPVSLLVTTRSSRPLPVVSTASTSETPRPTGIVTGGKNCGVTSLGLIGPTNLGTEEDRERAVAGVANDQVGQAVPVQVGRDDLRGQNARRQPPGYQHEDTVAIGVERDLVIVSIHTGEDRALIRIRNPGDVARRIAGVDRDGGLEGARLAGNPLAIEDIPDAVDDRQVGHTVAVQVCDEGCVVRNQPARTGLGELAVPLVQLDCDDCWGIVERSPDRICRPR